MKMDKEFLLKNRFWVSLIAFGPIWLLILLIALIVMGDKYKTYAKAVADSETAVKGLKDIKNDSFTDGVGKRKTELEKQKDKVWAEAWKGQRNLMFWPDNPRFRSKVALETTGYFGQELAPGERADFKEPGIYDAQLPVKGENGIQERLKPIDAKPSWDDFIRRPSFKEKDPTNEEIWLAQEDLWVQKELLDVVKAALDSAARFENVANFKRADIPKAELENAAPPQAPATPGAAPPPASPGLPGAEDAKKPAVLRQRFRNPHWQLDLVMEPNEKTKELTATTETRLTNIDDDHVKLPIAGLDLEVGQRSATPPAPVHLVFAGSKPDAQLPFGGVLPLAKAVPLPRFAANFDDLPLEVTLVSDKSDPPLPELTVRKRFRNPNWELDLLLVSDGKGQVQISDKSTITNINSTQRTLSLSTAQFDVRRQGERDPVARIIIPAEWLAWKETTELKDIKKSQGTFGFERTRPIEIEVDEVFTWATSPIKRIDAIELYYNSHRTANLALKPAAQFPVAEAPKETTAGGLSGGMGAIPPPGGGLSGGAPGGGSDSSKTPNGLVRNRYISVTEQVRHMPVALALVVDQAHMQDVLTAVINSRLRIQITQVQWKRIRGVKAMLASNGPGGSEPPGVPGGGTSGPGRFSGSGPRSPGGGGPGGVSGGGPGGVSGGPMSPPGGGGSGTKPPTIPGRGASGGGSTTTVPGSGDDSDPNLVEMAVYGIAALYERYPPRPPAQPESPGSPPGLPGTPPVKPPK